MTRPGLPPRRAGGVCGTLTWAWKGRSCFQDHCLSLVTRAHSACILRSEGCVCSFLGHPVQAPQHHENGGSGWGALGPLCWAFFIGGS